MVGLLIDFVDQNGKYGWRAVQFALPTVDEACELAAVYCCQYRETPYAMHHVPGDHDVAYLCDIALGKVKPTEMFVCWIDPECAKEHCSFDELGWMLKNSRENLKGLIAQLMLPRQQ